MFHLPRSSQILPTSLHTQLYVLHFLSLLKTKQTKTERNAHTQTLQKHKNGNQKKVRVRVRIRSIRQNPQKQNEMSLLK